MNTFLVAEEKGGGGGVTKIILKTFKYGCVHFFICIVKEQKGDFSPHKASLVSCRAPHEAPPPFPDEAQHAVTRPPARDPALAACSQRGLARTLLAL